MNGHWIDWIGWDWIWGDGRFLWLLPLALLPFLRRRARSVSVASTAPWLGIAGGRDRERTLPRVIAIAALILAAAGPRLVPNIDSGTDGIAVRRLDGVSVVDHPAFASGIVRVESSGGELWAEGDADRPGSLALPVEAAGQRGRVIRPDGGRIAISVPHPPPLPTVRDCTASPAVGRALAALEEAGRIEQVPADDPRPVTIEIASAERAPHPCTARILFPTAARPRPRILPVPQTTESPLLAGLVPERWTILAASPLLPAGEVLLEDTGGTPLIVASPTEIDVAFLPEESDLPERIEWPVLLGRSIEYLAPDPLPIPRSSPVATILCVLVALGALPFAVRSRQRRIIGAVGIAGALLLPPIPILAVGRVSLGEGPPAAALVAAAARLPGGGVIEVPADRPLPFEEEWVAAHCAARRVGLAVIPAPVPTLVVRPPSISLGAVVMIHSSGSHRGEGIAVAPDGTEVAIGLVTADTPLEFEPRAPGVWEVRSEGAVPALIEVAAPIAVAVMTGVGTHATGARALFADQPMFQVLDRRDAAAVAALPPLPSPADSAILLWDDADPELLSPADATRLGAWLAAGGTLFAVAAPPFRGAEGETLLDPMLPVPLPPPPRLIRRDHGVLLLDLSGSVSGAGLEILWAGVSVLLGGTSEEDRWAVAGFRETTSWIIPPGAALDAGALVRLRSAAAAGGGTRLDRALAFARGAITAQPDLAPQLLLITDGRSTPADWQAIGSDLRGAGISLRTIAIGSDARLDTLRALHAGAGGEFRIAADAPSAVRILAEAIDPPNDRWQPCTGPLRATGQFAEGWPGALDGPRRLLSAPPAVPAGARVALVDATGSPLLWIREIGRGRSILLWSGLGSQSLPEGRASSRFREALTAAIARATRGAGSERRPARWRIDRKGIPRLVIDRSPEDSPNVRGMAISPRGEEIPIRGSARGRSWEIEGAQFGEALARVEIGRSGRTAGIVGAPERGDSAWLSFAGRLPAPPENAWLFLEKIVLAAIALQLALGKVAGQDDQA